MAYLICGGIPACACCHFALCTAFVGKALSGNRKKKVVCDCQSSIKHLCFDVVAQDSGLFDPCRNSCLQVKSVYRAAVNLLKVVLGKEVILMFQLV